MSVSIENLKHFLKYPWATMHCENAIHYEDYSDAPKSLVNAIKGGSFQEALDSVFISNWEETPQGDEYWANIWSETNF